LKIKKANGNTNLVISFNNEKLIPLLYGDLDKNFQEVEALAADKKSEFVMEQDRLDSYLQSLR